MDKYEMLMKTLKKYPTLLKGIIDDMRKGETKKKKKELKKIVNERKAAAWSTFEKGGSLEDVGEILGVTRERARQILRKDPRYKTQLTANRKQRKELSRMRSLAEKECPGCKRHFFTPKVAPRTYCSVKCHGDHRRQVPYPEWVGDRPIQKKYYTKEEWRVLNNFKTKYSYHKHNEKRRAYARKQYRKQTERFRVYALRAKERRDYGHAITPIENPKRPDMMKD